MGSTGSGKYNINNISSSRVNDLSVLDVRGVGIGTQMPTAYKQTSQNYYNAVATSIQDSDIRNLNINSPQEVSELAMKLLKSLNARGHTSCYRFAAAVAAIFDKAGVSYKCLVGFAHSNPSKQMLDNQASLKSNHVWIEANGRVFEYFTSQGSNIIHLNISDEIKFKKK